MGRAAQGAGLTPPGRDGTEGYPPQPGETPEQYIRRFARESWNSDPLPPPDGADEEHVLLSLREVRLHPLDPASLQFFRLLLAEAPPGGRLAVRTPEWAWPLVQALQREVNPDVTLHWVDSNGLAPAPPEEPVGATDPVGLHRWVWEAAEPSWRTGQYRQSVLDAATCVEEWTRRKLGSYETAAKLYQQAFGLADPTPDQPRLRFPNVSKSETPHEWTKPSPRRAADGGSDHGYDPELGGPHHATTRCAARS